MDIKGYISCIPVFKTSFLDVGEVDVVCVVSDCWVDVVVDLLTYRDAELTSAWLSVDVVCMLAIDWL